jgi:hypothetical protein
VLALAAVQLVPHTVKGVACCLPECIAPNACSSLCIKGADGVAGFAVQIAPRCAQCNASPVELRAFVKAVAVTVIGWGAAAGASSSSRAPPPLNAVPRFSTSCALLAVHVVVAAVVATAEVEEAVGSNRAGEPTGTAAAWWHGVDRTRPSIRLAQTFSVVPILHFAALTAVASSS